MLQCRAFLLQRMTYVMYRAVLCQQSYLNADKIEKIQILQKKFLS
jgi:hypothetical protein